MRRFEEAVRRANASMVPYCGLLAGFSTIMRPTNATMLVGLGVCVVMVPLERRDVCEFAPRLVPRWQSVSRSPLRGNCIRMRFISGAHSPAAMRGGCPKIYGTRRQDLQRRVPIRSHDAAKSARQRRRIRHDSARTRRDARRCGAIRATSCIHSRRRHLRLSGSSRAVRASANSAARRLMWFGLGYLAALTGLYCFYIFTDVAFILPGAFILFIAAGAGAAVANRWTREVLRNRDRSAGQFAAAAGVIVLEPDADRVDGYGSRRAHGRAPRGLVDRQIRWSRWIPRCRAMRPWSATSPLQFLELYLRLAETTSSSGLNSLDKDDPGERFTDYHLHRLYEKRAAGWNGPVPAVVFDGGANVRRGGLARIGDGRADAGISCCSRRPSRINMPAC